MGGHVLFETGIRRLGSKDNGLLSGHGGDRARGAGALAHRGPQGSAGLGASADRPQAKVQTVGYNSVGRLQYVYSAKYREHKEQEKFERVLRFVDALPKMRKTTSGHLRTEGLGFEKVLAAMTRLMNVAYFRVGDERHAKKNGTYGIATLRRKHLSIDGDTMTFEYSGKWGKTHRKVVTDRRLRKVVEECAALPGYEVFKYVDDGKVRDVKARDLNLYVKQVMGDEFTPRDFRTWAGTLIAAVKLAELGPATEPKHADKNVFEAVNAVAERLGNTRDIARASYISPRVIDHYLEGSVVAYHAEHLDEVIAAKQGDLTDGEKALLDLLKKEVRRDLRDAA